MRELKRSIARAHMLDAGAKRINKKRTNGKSYFATYWRFWFVYDPKDKRRNRRNENLLTRIIDGLKIREAMKASEDG